MLSSSPLARRLKAALIGLVPVIVAVLAIALTGGNDAGPVTVTIGPPAARSQLELPPAAQTVEHVQAAQDAAGDEEAAHSDLRDTTPAAPAVVAHNDQLKPAGQPILPAHPPLAAVHTPGCQTHLVRNFSSRNGAPVLLFVIHYTVSTDNGWAGVLGNVSWFNNPAAQASSNYIIDRLHGDCALTVAEASKAWAQAGFNPWALSVEVTARGTEGSLVAGAGRARLLALMRRAHDVYGIPYRHGAVSGCRVIRSGYVEHADLGACGGGHHDTEPYSIDPYITAAAASEKPSAGDVAACRKITAYRHRRAHTSAGTRLYQQRRGQLHRHGFNCLTSGAIARRRG